MSWSYSEDPSTSKLDECRFIIMDTNSNQPVLSDEEIQFLIEKSEGNDNLLKYNLFLQATTKFAQSGKRSLGPQSEDYSDRLNFYKSQLKQYKALVSAGSGISLPKFSGPKNFWIGMHNNPPRRKPKDSIDAHTYEE